jgi:pSer/pThr/pTyr-binding forkhead associated (FHA) protein
VTLLLSRTARDEVVVGRGRSCDVMFGGPAVSRRHARFSRLRGVWRITDLGSTNGTFVDGVQVEQAPVRPGTRVRLGDSFIEIE